MIYLNNFQVSTLFEIHKVSGQNRAPNIEVVEVTQRREKIARPVSQLIYVIHISVLVLPHAEMSGHQAKVLTFLHWDFSSNYNMNALTVEL